MNYDQLNNGSSMLYKYNKHVASSGDVGVGLVTRIIVLAVRIRS